MVIALNQLGILGLILTIEKQKMLKSVDQSFI